MDQILLTKLSRVYNPKGNILHGIKKSDNGFVTFGEAYFSTVKYKEIKGWKMHKLMTLNLIVPNGNINIVTMDCRRTNLTEPNVMSFQIGESNYMRLTIPPNIYVAFQGISKATNLLLNIADMEHDPDEAENLPIDSFMYDWE